MYSYLVKMRVWAVTSRAVDELSVISELSCDIGIVSILSDGGRSSRDALFMSLSLQMSQ
jgi:hypothetical protein